MAGFGNMMLTFGKMRQALKTVSVVGKAGDDLVVVTFNKKDDLSTYMSDIKISQALLRDHPGKVAQLVKEAVNDGLSKEMQEVEAAMPADAMAKMDELMKAGVRKE